MSRAVSAAAPRPAAAPGTAARRGARKGARGVRRPWTEHGLVFAAPFLAAFALFLVWPLAQGARLSLSDENIAGIGGQFVGFDNYAEAFHDEEMWRSLWHTVWFTVLSTPPLVLLGLGLALLTHHLRFADRLWRLSFFAPFMLPSTVVAFIWVWMYQPGFGLLDQWLGSVGVGHRVGWLTDSAYAMPSIALTTVWWTVGFNFLLYLAALQAVPRHLYEAAELDGAGPWARLWHITLPQLRRTTGLVAVLQVLASMKIFDQVYLMTGGGPDLSTRPAIEYMYDVGFTGYRAGYASAVSYILFALILLVSLAQLRLTRVREED